MTVKYMEPLTELCSFRDASHMVCEPGVGLFGDKDVLCSRERKDRFRARGADVFPEIIASGGAGDDTMPPNTLRAFTRALASAVNGVSTPVSRARSRLLPLRF